MLNIESVDDEFQVKSGCDRRKSVDFSREKVIAKLNVNAQLHRGGSIHKRQNQNSIMKKRA